VIPKLRRFDETAFRSSDDPAPGVLPGMAGSAELHRIRDLARPRPAAGRSRRPEPHLRRWRGPLTLVLAVVASLALVSPALAADGDTGTTADPQTQQDQNRAQRQQVDSELDDANQTYDQLRHTFDDLTSQLQATQAAANQARADQALADAQVTDLDEQVDQARVAADAARAEAADRAVQAYMRPDRETASQVLAARDAEQLGTMHTLVVALASYNHSVIEARVAADQQLQQRLSDAQTARDGAQALATQEQSDLDHVAALHAQQQQVKTQLEQHIGDLHGEQAALDAKESDLEALIRQRSQPVDAAGSGPTSNGSGPAAPDGPASAPSTTAAPTTTTTAVHAPPPGPGQPTTTRPPPTTAPPTTAPPKRGVTLQWPCSGPITSPFGQREGEFHKGIDIGVPTGTPIHAAAAGTVILSSGTWDPEGYGNVVIIDHGNGISTLYGHQSQLLVTEGQHVSAGQVIGLSGSTGHSTGPHLHFEVRLNGTAVDPRGYLP
jgi:murein DD-endopeptidase MepM/ murein hydrolase activator NlpD